jgi:hypothetical protein
MKQRSQKGRRTYCDAGHIPYIVDIPKKRDAKPNEPRRCKNANEYTNYQMPFHAITSHSDYSIKTAPEQNKLSGSCLINY